MKLLRLLVVPASLAVVAVLAGCGGSGSGSGPAATAAPRPQGHVLLAPADAVKVLADPPAGLVVLDVRTPAEFAAGHLAEAIDIDINDPSFAAGIAALDPNATYFVYCRTGHRSAAAVAHMQQLGFKSIYELDGGITAWQSAGLPTS
jgi:rhodanese-related sulfurtransferase